MPKAWQLNLVWRMEDLWEEAGIKDDERKRKHWVNTQM